jgi:hypothetical protein
MLLCQPSTDNMPLHHHPAFAMIVLIKLPLIRCTPWPQVDQNSSYLLPSFFSIIITPIE